MELDKRDGDQGRGAEGGEASDQEMEEVDIGGASDQEVEDGDTILVADSVEIGSPHGSLAPDSRNSKHVNAITQLDPSNGNRVSVTPLFVSSHEVSLGSEASVRFGSSLRQSLDLPEGVNFAVLVPPVRRRWEYQTVNDDPRVTRILKEDKKVGLISYAVESRDGRILRVS